MFVINEAKASFIRRILVASNAIETIDDEMIHLIYCLNCILRDRNATFETGLRLYKFLIIQDFALDIMHMRKILCLYAVVIFEINNKTSGQMFTLAWKYSNSIWRLCDQMHSEILCC